MSGLGLYENDVELFEPEGGGRGGVGEGESAPAVPLLRFIPFDGSPNRLLEYYTPDEALEVVTEQHLLIADWIRAQEWRHNVPRECYRYIVVTRRMKACRNQLRKLVAQIEKDNQGNGC